MSHRVIIIDGESITLPDPVTLSAKQQMFGVLATVLQVQMLKKGYTFTFGETFRTDEQAAINALGLDGRCRLASLVVKVFPDLAAKIVNNGGGGIAQSLHALKLAMDVNLFKGGAYLSKSEDHRAFGEFWESLDPLCRWGGRWGDGNHYSIEHGGVK